MSLLIVAVLGLLSCFVTQNPGGTPSSGGAPGVGVVASSCTPIGRNVSGDTAWEGCPTNACPGGGLMNPCQGHDNTGPLGQPATRAWCECQDHKQTTCQATLNLDPFGLVTGFGCANNGCGHACLKVAIPFPIGPNPFYFCDC